MLDWKLPQPPVGFLFIGDPHVSSVRPGKRTDDYQASVLAKLSEAARVATAQRLVPVILGDLIHREGEGSIGLISRLTLVLREFPCTPFEVEGNHGRASNELAPEDVEFLLAASGTLQLLGAGSVQEFEFDGRQVRLHAVPHGVALPESLPSQDGVFQVIVSHLDLAFEGAYPGAASLREIPGCDMLVNGHMHKTAPSVVRGMTTLHCPGNIEPLSIDVKDHKPAVWAWTPSAGPTLTPHYLRHQADCFDLSGRLVKAADATASVHAVVGSDTVSMDGVAVDASPSLFAQRLQEQAGLDRARTDEAAFLGEDLDAVLSELSASEATSQLLRGLAEQVSREAAEKATPA